MGPVGLRHAQVEAALALATGVGPEGKAKLSSNLKYLRTMRVPVPTMPKSDQGGAPLIYTRGHVLELLIALNLLALGQQADYASSTAAQVVSLVTWEELEQPGDILFFTAAPRGKYDLVRCRSRDLAEVIAARVAPVAAVVNVTRLVRAMDEALKQVVFGE